MLKHIAIITTRFEISKPQHVVGRGLIVINGTTYSVFVVISIIIIKVLTRFKLVRGVGSVTVIAQTTTYGNLVDNRYNRNHYKS